ncbi:hypothetical protein B0T17DRAFT_653941 [Bombardia bombarda]|uniref:Peptidase S8/S53 domain-containing protein n=1 Tax=Bombardia bombarda TaxID=252184 RepID=A0AA39XAU1_9PEZI|nr:hypothetical protein B0T17DRAFT_653941 [Bombardia bombarda]
MDMQRMRTTQLHTSDSDDDTIDSKRRKQPSWHNNLQSSSPRKEAASAEPYLTVRTKSETCEALRKLVADTGPSSDSLQEDLEKVTRGEHSDYFKTKKSRTGGPLQTNIVHELVLASKEKKWKKDEIEKVLVFVLKLSGQHATGSKKLTPYLMEELLEEDFGSGTPILQALTAGRNRNRPFVEVVLRLRPKPSNLGKIFWQPTKKYNIYCLHTAISSAKAKADGFDHIHDIVQHILDYQPPQLKPHDRSSRRPKNKPPTKAPISPLKAREETGHNTALHLAILKAPIELVVNTESESSKTGGGSHTGAIVPRSPSMAKSEKLVKALVEASADSLGLRNGKAKDKRDKVVRRTPYQERIYRLAIEFDKWKTGHPQIIGGENNNNSSALENTDSSHGAVSVETTQESAAYVSDGDEDNCEHNLPLESTLAQSYYGDDAFREFVISDPIASYINHYCIAHKYREKAMKYLYRLGEERATEFDLLGFPRKKITQDYLSSLETHVRFERTLKYVALPRLAVETTRASNGTQFMSSPTGQKTHEAADMTEIFHWLYRRHVRKIQKVTVLDSELSSHHDQKIIEALKEFEVEEWDWDKMDLSSHVISDSSKFIRDIYLHSSGNSAVLEGWCSSAGFGNREKFPQLKKIVIYFHEGQETEQTLRERGNNIQTRLESGEYEHNRWKLSEAQAIATDIMTMAKKLMALRTTGESIDENSASLMTDLESRLLMLNALKVSPVEQKFKVEFDVVLIAAQTGSLRTRRTTDSTDNFRINKIKEFTNYIRNSPWIERPQISRVKIAIIDDGLDPSLSIIDRKHSRVIAGQSFCTYSGYTQNYYVPSGNHGTQLASVICQICPEVDLVIARLAEQDTRSGNRVILLDSAERAIKWATDCGVDIMCMSWTIEDRDKEDSPRLSGLRSAISAAHKKGIILFCSASDQGGGSMVQGCYPGAFDGGKKCIRVGSCSASDVPSVWVDPDQVDFLLPGENLPIRNSDGNPEPQTGSSFATALATGLAGLILYCTLRLGTGITPSAARSHGNEAEDDGSGADTESNHEGGDDSDAESVDSRDSKAPPSNTSSGHSSQGKNGAGKVFWNRDLMFKVLQQMSKPVGATPDNLLLILPEVFLVSRVYEELKKLKGRKIKTLDKLVWDNDFSTALHNVLHLAINYQDNKQGYKKLGAR